MEKTLCEDKIQNKMDKTNGTTKYLLGWEHCFRCHLVSGT